MKPENRKAYLDKAKTDHRIHEDGHKIPNWWENEGISKGTGTIKEEILLEIEEGFDEYEYQLQEDEAEYNKLLTDSLNE